MAYLDRTGSGNETAAHIRAGGRAALMFCSSEGPPLIPRLYGNATVLHRHNAAFDSVLADHFNDKAPLGTRLIVTLEADLVQTSCGYGVRFFEYQGERDTMGRWAAAKSETGIAD